MMCSAAAGDRDGNGDGADGGPRRIRVRVRVRDFFFLFFFLFLFFRAGAPTARENRGFPRRLGACGPSTRTRKLASPSGKIGDVVVYITTLGIQCGEHCNSLSFCSRIQPCCISKHGFLL